MFPTARFPLAETPPPPALVLISAIYSVGPSWLTLAFDRDIDLTAYDGSALFVMDGDNTGNVFDGTGGVSYHGSQGVRINLSVIGPTFFTGVLLNAPTTTGIVAVNNGGTWPGAKNLPLPWP